MKISHFRVHYFLNCLFEQFSILNESISEVYFRGNVPFIGCQEKTCIDPIGFTQMGTTFKVEAKEVSASPQKFCVYKVIQSKWWIVTNCIEHGKFKVTLLKRRFDIATWPRYEADRTSPNTLEDLFLSIIHHMIVVDQAVLVREIWTMAEKKGVSCLFTLH